MAAQTAAVENLVTRIAAIENSHTTWRNATLHILRRYLPDNPGKEICENTGHWW